jgi:PTS system glucitol/sorbitol-specific IIA component
MKIYSTVVKEIGPHAAEFLAEEMLVTFGDNAPSELRPYCFLIDVNEIAGTVEAGDRVVLDGTSYTVTAVGDTAVKNLVDLGHVTLNFKGETEAGMAGTLYLEKKAPVTLTVGSTFMIEKK